MSWAQAQSALGIAALLGLCWLASADRRAVSWRLVAGAVAAQLVLAVLLSIAPPIRAALEALAVPVRALQAASDEAAAFVFGDVAGEGLSIAFEVLPIVVIVSALSAVLWHWGALAAATRGLAWLLGRTLGLSGGVAMGGAANFFLGVVEAPLFLRGLLARFSRAELFAVMTLGLATVSGVVLALYAAVLEPVKPGAIADILTASALSLPAALAVAALLEPGPQTSDGGAMTGPTYENAVDALARGAIDGMGLFLNIVALLLVVVATVALIDAGLGWVGPVGDAPLTLDRLVGWALAPLMWLIGVPWSEAATAGALMGVKAILNEFFAYLRLAELPEGALSPRSETLLIYALCGFANLGSIGMMVAAIGALAPERRGEVARLGPRAWLAGNAATLLTAAVVGVLTRPG